MKFYHLKQLEQLKSEPNGSFLMLSIHLSFEEIIADLNSANPTSAISFLASFTRFSIVANGSLIKLYSVNFFLIKNLTIKAILFNINTLYMYTGNYEGNLWLQLKVLGK